VRIGTINEDNANPYRFSNASSYVFSGKIYLMQYIPKGEVE